MKYQDIINETIGFQTRKSWESETVSDQIERKARKALIEELQDCGASESQAREIAPWRIKDLRAQEWNAHREAKDKTATCPCGATVKIPQLDNGESDIMGTSCPSCKRTATWGNSKTGEIFEWITRKDLVESNAEYGRQSFSADNNELYGKGNW